MFDSQDNHNVYKQRKHFFQNQLISDLGSITYVILIFKYVAFNDYTVVLFLRLIMTNILKRLYTKVKDRARFYEHNGYLNRIRMFSGVSPTDVTPDDEQLSAEVQEKIIELKFLKPARFFLFNLSFSFNSLMVLLSIIFPIDFKNNWGYYADGASPTIQSNSLFIDFLGMNKDISIYGNFKGNLFNILLEFIILYLHFSIYQLTCFDQQQTNDSQSGSDLVNQEESISHEDSDGYDGDVIVTKIDFVSTFEKVFSKNDQSINNEADIV
ncbi:Gld1p SCDLUD_002351 [Saccharomycodes ludwigii]|uniref:Gld1p n=1 Tax=Saccharomycodes ludwigii TaxID=36035 RepID=UPI001E858B68|nr:hypothetical protein SCDLUD_002351 [Saccharomycodes ludwigii]KAH3900892.1 hypothetical protein SCDLUD_002351 [Saccharomycodes ludwigii]